MITANRVALYGKHPKGKYYRLQTVTFDKTAAAMQGRKLREARAVDMWFTKEFPPGVTIPDTYLRVPLDRNQKGGKR